MKRLFLVVFCSIFLCQIAMADDKQIARDFLVQKIEKVISIIQTKNLSRQEKDKKIIELVRPVFDFPRMAKLALGRKHWPGLAKEKQKRFTELFIQNAQASYLDKLNLYTNEKVIYDPPVQVKKKIHVPTYLISKDNKISMVYKLYKSKQNWKIYDLEVQGVSIIQTYRSQFDQILRNGTIDDLLAKLEKQ